ncbi:MAG: hypothetical protein J5I93_06850 [Pirellulaceae bacterium]|nr:hypothetical protein [Pirellulaceae bacterium]
MNCDRVFEILTRGPFPSGDPADPQVERHLLVCHECRLLAEALRPAVELLHECVEPEESRQLPGYRGMLDHGWPEQPVREPRVAAADMKLSPWLREDLASMPRPGEPRRPGPQSSAGDQRGRTSGAAPTDTSESSGRGWWPLTTAALAASLLLALLLGLAWDARRSLPGERLLGPALTSADVPVGLAAPGPFWLSQVQLPASCRDPLRIPPVSTGEPRSRTEPKLVEPKLVEPVAWHLDSGNESNQPARAEGGYLCCTHCHLPGSPHHTSATTLATVVRSCEACHSERGLLSAALRGSRM